MDNMTYEIKSTRSNTIFTVTGDKSRAYLTVSGEASTNRKVLAEVDRSQRVGGGSGRGCLGPGAPRRAAEHARPAVRRRVERILDERPALDGRGVVGRA